MKYKFTHFLGLLLTTVLLISCGAERKNPIAKGYQNMTSLFNGYYNAERKWREGVREIDETFQVPPSGYIDILYVGSDEDSKTFGGIFDEAIKKCEVVLTKHPNSNWQDDCHFLMGRAWFYKKNYILARKNLEWVLEQEPDSKLVPEVYLWLVKSHYLMGNEATAKKILKEKVPNGELSKDDLGELALFKAQMMINEGDLVGVVETLEGNIKNIRGKLNRARAHFLLGQVYAEQERFSRSYEHYKKVTRINADYQLIFNAKIRIAKLFIENSEGKDETQRITKLLTKMLKDEKNTDYIDQIYFELAMLDLKKGDRPQAIEDLRYSIRYNNGNTRQKALSYYNIGQIYFNDLKDFTMAQAYFDSASQAITKDAPEYQEISTISATLREYIDYVNTIEYQDSMIQLAGLSEDALDKRIDRVIAEEKRQEQARMRKEMEEVDRFNDPNLFGQQGNQGNNNRGGSGFYFDDEQLVSNGKLQFERVWGRRKLEDNWRRRHKNMELFAEETTESAPIDSALIKKFGDKAKYYRDIPKNEEEIEVARNKVIAAMYGLGQVYQNKLMIPDSAIKTYKLLEKRFPEDEYAIKAQYALFKIYQPNDPNLAERYKDKICGKSPRSIYCRLCNNEDVAEELNAKDEEFASAYTALYATYNEKDYSTAIDFSNFILTKWYTGPEIPKVLYLRGLSFGYLGQKDSLKKTFTYLKNNFPEAEVTEIAIRTLALMNGGTTQPGENRSPGNTSNPRNDGGGSEEDRPGEESSPGSENAAYQGFTTEKKANEKVYAVMLVDKEAIQSQALQIKITDFNKQFFASDNLTVSIFFYKKSHHLAYISQFDSYEEAKAYVSLAAKNESIQSGLQSQGDRIVFITPQNFRTAYGKKRFEDYLLYFDNVLLKSLNE